MPTKLPEIRDSTPRGSSKSLLPDIRGSTPRGSSKSVTDGSTLPVPEVAVRDSSKQSSRSATSQGEVDLDVTEPQVQTTEEIRNEVRKLVHSRKPWRGEYDEAVLEERSHMEREDVIDRSFHIILPDNRVRAVEDRLSRRIRAQLLGEPEPIPEGTTLRFGASAVALPKRTQKPRNPWYLPAHKWYSGANGSDVIEDGSGMMGEFSYYVPISKVEAKPGSLADEQVWQDAMKSAVAGDDDGSTDANDRLAEGPEQGSPRRSLLAPRGKGR
mmetsp:Transcript_65838/g.122836  ORF Transcript_65838/g.122836 Transcript_65838/m.122836 type:complete len:270 (-) Transcript_65838:81-890(-)